MTNAEEFGLLDISIFDFFGVSGTVYEDYNIIFKLKRTSNMYLKMSEKEIDSSLIL